MENIDERDIDAARFEKQILDIWKEGPNQMPEGGLKLAIFLLFTEQNSKHMYFPWSWADTETIHGLMDAKRRANDWLGLKVSDVTELEWTRQSQYVLDKLRYLVSHSGNSTANLHRLDFLVKSLGAKESSNKWARKVESFVADFAHGWSVSGRAVFDLNTLTTGELGVRLKDVDAVGDYILPAELQPYLFEVCLRLHAHGVRFQVEKQGADNAWNGVGAAYKFAWPTRSRSKLADEALPLELRGLEFAQWFLGHRYSQRITIVVLPSADLRAKDRLAEIRRDLLQRRCVLGVVGIPARVSGPKDLSMLIMAKEWPSTIKSVLLMNGRAVDGLRDEPLDRLARFLCAPFMDVMKGDTLSRLPYEAHLGDALLNRARKMYGAKLPEVPGFFRYVQLEEILDNQNAVLDPSQWISERDPMVASDLLDGSPVYKLLEERERPCCVYVIGNNGAGKSMLLRQLAKAYVTSGRPVRAIASATSDRFEAKMGATADYVYLGSRTSNMSTQPRRLGRKLAELMVAIHADRDKIAAVSRVLEQLSFAGQHYLLPESATSDVLESVRELGVDEAPSNMNGWKLGFRKNHENSIVPFDHLSTGEQQLLLLTARLVEYARPGVVFLIDEPETSLHVAWQRALPSVFQTISRDFNCQMVIATHSPILISTSRGDDTYRFMADGGVLEVIGEQAASSVERVLFQGFDTYTGNNREVHERCAELVSRAIEFANTEQTEMLQSVFDELQQMEEKVTRAVPALGSEVPARHLDLIRRATLAIEELTSSDKSEEARS
ncbi:AAA family ATPase [Aeromonas taiwanensis]|uniref:AAA family ATPase n=1 Tax=Aeromonas taiwanensis TaxID=633417 RepID=UPI0009DCF3F4|nr:AAA family ATPase [Aeromonas taiwanensis]